MLGGWSDEVCGRRGSAAAGCLPMVRDVATNTPAAQPAHASSRGAGASAPSNPRHVVKPELPHIKSMLQSPPIKTKGLKWSLLLLLLLLLLMLLFFAPDTGCCTSDAACSVGEAPLTPVLCSAEHCEVVEVVTACILQPEDIG